MKSVRLIQLLCRKSTSSMSPGMPSCSTSWVVDGVASFQSMNGSSNVSEPRTDKMVGVIEPDGEVSGRIALIRGMEITNARRDPSMSESLEICSILREVLLVGYTPVVISKMIV